MQYHIWSRIIWTYKRFTGCDLEDTLILGPFNNMPGMLLKVTQF